MSYKSKSENDYYSNYCAIKHYRNINNLHKANVNVLIRALGALYILNVYNKFQDDETDSFLNYDYTLGSKIFQVSGDIKPSQGDILKFIKNKNYENLKINFIENIPENDEELVMYANNNSFPSLFLVKINI